MGVMKERHDTTTRDPMDSPTHEVVYTTGQRATVVHRGPLTECEDWLALHGDRWRDGSFEIRPIPSGIPAT